MSNDSNRNAGRSNSPSELDASDFFPPGVGWNKDAVASPESPQQREARERNDGEFAIDGQRQH